MLAPSCLGDDLRADQESDLDADSGEADAGAARLGAGRDVVVARQLASAHTGAIVHDGERRRGGVGGDGDGGRTRVELVRYDLGEGRRSGRAWICDAMVVDGL